MYKPLITFLGVQAELLLNKNGNDTSTSDSNQGYQSRKESHQDIEYQKANKPTEKGGSSIIDEFATDSHEL